MLYYCKDYKNVSKDKKFLQSRFFVCFLGIASFILSLKLVSFISLNIRHFSQSGFFLFFELGKLLPELYEAFRVSASWNLRKFRFLKYKEFFRGFRFLKYKKSFLLRKHEKFLSIRARKFQGFEYNIFLRKYKKTPFPEN